MFTLGKTCLCASCFYRWINNFDVSLCRNRIANIGMSATCALTCVCCVTTSCTCWSSYNSTITVVECFDWCIVVGITTNGANVCCVATSCTCWSGYCGRVVVVARLFWNRCAFVLFSVTNCALFVLFAFGCVGWFFVNNPLPLVTKCWNFFLCYKNCVTYGAMFTFGQACVFAIGRNCSVDNFLVAKCLYLTSFGVIFIIFAYTSFGAIGCASCGDCFLPSAIVVANRWNYLLCYKNFATYQAMFTFGKTCFGTCCWNGHVDVLCVTLCRDNFLRYKYFATNSTMFAFGKTCFGTCCINGTIDSLGVAFSLYHQLWNDNVITNGAMLTFGKTIVCTSCSNCFVDNFGVTKRIYKHSFASDLLTTNSTVNNFVVGACC